jgi:hypothetical protein
VELMRIPRVPLILRRQIGREWPAVSAGLYN